MDAAQEAQAYLCQSFCLGSAIILRGKEQEGSQEDMALDPISLDPNFGSTQISESHTTRNDSPDSEADQAESSPNLVDTENEDMADESMEAPEESGAGCLPGDRAQPNPAVRMEGREMQPDAISNLKEGQAEIPQTVRTGSGRTLILMTHLMKCATLSADKSTAPQRQEPPAPQGR